MIMLTTGTATIEQKLARRARSFEVPLSAHANWGVGWPCAVCAAPIHADAIEVRALFAAHDPEDFHLHCFVRWWHAAGTHR